MGMSTERTYVEVSRFFHTWVSVMENHTRNLEVSDSTLHRSRILIISPPTDRGIETLSRANQFGVSYLLCFSPEIKNIAEKYCQRRAIHGIQMLVAPFFSIPIGTGELDAIYANCFFDSCPPSDLNAVVDELRRVLRQDGTLYSVNMGIPSSLMNHLWALLFRRTLSPARGFHPVNVMPSLSNRGFTILRNQRQDKFGFPLHYVKAVKVDAT